MNATVIESNKTAVDSGRWTEGDADWAKKTIKKVLDYAYVACATATRGYKAAAAAPTAEHAQPTLESAELAQDWAKRTWRVAREAEAAVLRVQTEFDVVSASKAARKAVREAIFIRSQAENVVAKAESDCAQLRQSAGL